MRDAQYSIRGSRVLGDPPKPPRELRMDYLHQSAESSELHKELWSIAPLEGAPCVGETEKWTGDELPTDREAQLMCAQCPLKVRKVCSAYAKATHPAWGVYDGKVFGRKLEELMKDGE